MGRFFYTDEQLEFLEEGYKQMNARDLTAAFNAKYGTNKSYGCIRSALRNHGFRAARPPGHPKGYTRLFSPEQIEFIKREYRRLSLPGLTAALRKRFGGSWSADQLRAFVNRQKIHSGRTGQFEKGHESWNKGTNFVAGGRSAETRFKKGQMPASTLPVGTEVVDRDGYRKVKISEGGKPGESRFNWKFVHVLEWEKHNGPVPKGHAVCFRDGDRSNCSIENLVLLSRNELRYLNYHGLTMADLPDELRKPARALARAESKRFERMEETKGG